VDESATKRINLGQDLQRSAELEAKNKEFQAAVAAAEVKLGGNIAKIEVSKAKSPLLS